LRGPDVEVEVVEGGLAHLLVSLPIPHLTPEMVAYLDLTSLLLTGDGDGSLYSAARRLGVELREARAFPVTPDGPGALVISLEVSANHLDQLWGALIEQLNTLKLSPPSLRQLEQVKLLLERESAQTRASLTHQARRLGFFSTRWSNANALSRYRRALSQVRPRELTSFLKDIFVSDRLHALVRSPAPKGLDGALWAERLRERAVAVMDQRELKLFPGFHALDDQLGLLFEPSPSEGVVSLSLTLPTRPSLTRASELSLGHWLAAQMSERQPYEPHIKARFHHEALELSATIDVRQLDDALVAMMRRVRGEPVSAERAWSSETLERARVKAMGALELTRHQPWRHISDLGDRVALAFDYPPLPSASERLHALKELGSAHLVRWYQEHVASAPALLVVTGDVSRAELSRALRASLERGQGSAFTEASLKRAPLTEPLKRCRRAHESSDRPLTWLNLRFGLHDLTPRDLPALALLEAALTTPQGAPYRALKRVEGVQRTLLRRGGAAHSPHLSMLFNVRSEQTSALMNALRDGVRSLTEAPLTPEALAELKRAARAREAHTLQHLNARAQWLSAAWFAGWRAEREGEGLLNAWWRALDQVSAEDLKRVSQAVLRFEQAAEAQWAPPRAPAALSGCSKVTL
jgi:predicted Zn-dependent peptidase